ncbi:hypothetical protein TDIS_0253 [Thermosulfurimonas dismutans]|uniref:Uncharacterized protein n=1 Tax=Thermosulfurimonas dismutans TaxID=999894 RepID=A0A179D6K0_9BACT|nr:hypothetical protein TDIS_0253 [Thermosulfurimonas dismutans]
MTCIFGWPEANLRSSSPVYPVAPTTATRTKIEPPEEFLYRLEYC